MELLNLSDKGAEPSCFTHALPSIVESIGRQEFSSSVFDFARRFLGVQHLTAFVSAPGGVPKPILAESANASDLARQRVEQYITRYWRYDPINMVVEDGSREPRTWTLRIGVNDLPNFSYRSDCYHAAGLTERLSVVERRPEGLMRANFYLERQHSFGDDVIDRVKESTPLLMAALWRHHQTISVGKGSGAASSFRVRLKKVAPSLSERELDVCSLVAGGVTSQGIALELGVGVNTVLTYRKRAYARLRISSQNELMRFLM